VLQQAPWHEVMGRWKYCVILSYPWHWLEIYGQLHVLAALPQWKCF